MARVLFRRGLIILMLGLAISVRAGFFSNRQAGKEIERARELVKEGRIEEALGVYENVIKRYSDSDYVGEAYLEIGKIYYAQGRYEDCVKAFGQSRRVPRNWEQLRDARLWLGRSYFQLRNYQGVIETLGDSYEDIRGSKEKIELSEMLYRSYIELKKYRMGILWLVRYLEFGGTKDIEQNKALVPGWLNFMSDSELMDVFKNPGPEWIRAEAGYILGTRYYRDNRLQEAKDVMEKILSLYPDNTHRDELERLINQSENLIQVVPTRIGLILPLSGTYQAFGERALKGALLAGQIFQYPAGIHSFEFRVENSYGDAELAKEAVERMILDDHIICVVGPVLNPVALAVSEVSERFSVPMISLSPGAGLTDNKNYVFRNSLTKESQVEALLHWAIKEKRYSKFAVIFPDDKYGTEFAEIFAREVQARGAELVQSVSYSAEETDFKDVIAALEPTALKKEKDKAKESEYLPLSFEVLFIADGYEKVGLIVPQLLFYRLKPQLLGTSSWHTEKIFEHCRKSYLEGAVFADLYAPELENRQMEDYQFRYEQAYKEEPSLIDLQSYETVSLLIDIIEKQRITDRRGLASALKSLSNWEGPLGQVWVNNSLEFSHQLHLFQIEKGKFNPLK